MLSPMLYLASKSPRRHELVGRLPWSQPGLEFGVLDLDIPEHPLPGEPAESYVRRVAREKAGAGLLKVVGNPAAVVLGSDTVVVIGTEAASLIGGLIVTETVFNIPGVARFLVEALRWRDYPIVQNLVMLIAVVVVVANFTVDMLYAAIDPRIRYTD